jgi:rSAM/selenodomain-associated transferase 1
MLKAPTPGTVKTRLGREIGPDEACVIYRRLVERQVSHIVAPQGLEIHYSPSGQREQMRSWLGLSRVYVDQVEGDLGDRLRHAMEGAFARGAQAVVLLGGDCPDVTETVIDAAVTQLESHDIVIGPAADGGYYLIAMKAPCARLFEEIDWSTEKVLRQTLLRVREMSLGWTLLPVFSDIDDLASLQEARATHAFLR